MIVTTVVSVFVGGYIAVVAAPVLGWLHGLLAWALMTLFVLLALTSVISGAVGVAGNLANAGATAVTSGGSTDGAAGSLSEQARNAIASIANAPSMPPSEDAVRQTADAAARTVARASWFSVAALLVGFVIAVAAGTLGFRHQPAFEKGQRTRATQTSVPLPCPVGVSGRH